MADWKEIEAEYITTQTSYRELAQKYGLNQTTVARRAKAGDWVGRRKRQAGITRERIISAVEGEKVSRALKLQIVADKLLDRVEAMAEGDDGIGAAGLKTLSEVLKILKDVQMIRSDADVREQEAKIRNLEKQGNIEQTEQAKLVVEGLPEEFRV
ncbi:MAG: hypothetical protein ACI3V5_00205 [Faecousia sp.]